MKKFYFVALMAFAAVMANAQPKINISTYQGTNVQQFDGMECNVTAHRLVFTGWNTIALPFDLTESELNEIFGSDCKLEKLVGVENLGSNIVLNFQDCKANGLQANVPYILYYTGEYGSKKIAKTAIVSAGNASVSYMTKNGQNVTMACAQSHIDGVGLYGVLASDNAEATFVKVSPQSNGFYATRCYVQVDDANSPQLTTNHLAAGEISGISDVMGSDEIVDVYNISGVKVASGINAAQVGKLQRGVYVINGQKVLVK